MLACGNNDNGSFLDRFALLIHHRGAQLQTIDCLSCEVRIVVCEVITISPNARFASSAYQVHSRTMYLLYLSQSGEAWGIAPSSLGGSTWQCHRR